VSASNGAQSVAHFPEGVPQPESVREHDHARHEW
jgi:hypothetical protein